MLLGQPYMCVKTLDMDLIWHLAITLPSLLRIMWGYERATRGPSVAAKTWSNSDLHQQANGQRNWHLSVK